MKRIVFAIVGSLLLSSCVDGTNVNRHEPESVVEEVNDDERLYGDNSLETGERPYQEYYGANKKCDDYYCSRLTIKTPNNSDAVVIVKQNDNVVAHAYIESGSKYTFHLPDGTYQPFFYMGNGWNPNKQMSEGLMGGFVSDESFSKDYPQELESCELTYELIRQANGNFQTKPSGPDEMF